MQDNREIEKYVRLHYGNLVTIGEVEATLSGCAVRLKVDYPAVFTDDKTKERTIRFVPIGQVGTLMFNSNLKVQKFTAREECAKRIVSNLRKLVERSERIVVRASAKRLAKVAIVREALNPVFILADHFLEQPEITYEEIRGLKRPRKFKQYLNMLSEIGIVEKGKGEVFTSGAAFSNLWAIATKEEAKRADQEKALEESLIAYVLSKRYDTIREVFHISRMETYVHADNSYYKPALEADRLLHQTENSLISRYNNLYGFKSPLRLRPVLKELVGVGAMEHDGTHYFGVQDLFNDMKAIKSEMPFAESLIA